MHAALPYYIVNAFTETIFGGNPAAVMVLDQWLPDERMQALAAQHNLSETGFLVKQSDDTFALRWFTPTAEVPLCGHATLAAAHVLKNELGVIEHPLRFETRFRGSLFVSEEADGIAIDLPALSCMQHDVEDAVEIALGAGVVSAVRPVSDPWQVIYELKSETAVRALKPDITALASAVNHCVIVTAEGSETDFVSRMFAPNLGVDEDPVTGSAHCLLAPFWAQRLGGGSSLSAEQCSARGGRLRCILEGDRVKLVGQAVTFAIGHIAAEALGEC